MKDDRPILPAAPRSGEGDALASLLAGPSPRKGVRVVMVRTIERADRFEVQVAGHSDAKTGRYRYTTIGSVPK